MNKDDVIKMAHDAGLHIATDVNWMPIIGLKYLEKFAALVAAAEREACIQVCENHIAWAKKYSSEEVRTYEQVAETLRARGQE